MRTSRRLAIAWLAWLAGIAGTMACTTFGTEAPTESLPEGGTDGASDAPVISADAADASDAAPGRFCLAHTSSTLCADFDHDGPVSFGCQASRGIVQRDLTRFVSAPASARFEQQATEAYLELKPTGTPALALRQRLSFDLRPPSAPDAGTKTYDISFASLDQGGRGCVFGLEAFVDSARLNIAYPPDDAGIVGYDTADLTAFPAPGKFSHVEVLFESKGVGVHVEVTIEGFKALDKSLACPNLSTSPLLRIGVLPLAGSSNGTVSIDNALLDTK